VLRSQKATTAPKSRAILNSRTFGRPIFFAMGWRTAIESDLGP